MDETLGHKGQSTPGGIRTPNHLIRSQVLYPIEPRVHPKIGYVLNSDLGKVSSHNVQVSIFYWQHYFYE